MNTESPKSIPIADLAKPADLRDLYLDLLKQAVCASIYEESAWQYVEPIDPHTKKPFIRNPLSWIRDRIRVKLYRNLAEHGRYVITKNAFDLSKREQGLDWPFIGYSMIGHRRMEHLRQCIESVLKNQVPGDLIETGVWRGGAIIYMRGALKRTESRIA
ncbi:MAG: TylF/MycF/NovP-related O-methyltransferase [Pirellulales bacterium]